MSKKRGKKPNPTASKGASMSDSVGRVTYGAGYEGDDRSAADEVKETVQDAAGAVVDTASAAVSTTAGAVGAVVDTAG